MKKILKKFITLILALSISISLLPSHAFAASGDDSLDPATLMLYAAHARISEIDDRAQLKSMKDNYMDYYADLLNNANLDEEQKAQLIALRDGKIAAIEQKINDLEVAWRRKQHARSPLSVLGDIAKGGKKVLTSAGGIVGRGIKAAGDTVANIIKNPEELIKTAVTIVVTGGTSSFKDAILTIVKSQVKREAKKAAYVELVKIAYENPTLRKAVKLKNFLGIKGSDELEEALEEYLKQQHEIEVASSADPSTPVDSGGAGYDGEGGYDEDNDSAEYIASLKSSLEQSDAYITFAGTYTMTSFNISPVSDEKIAFLIESQEIWEANLKTKKILLDESAVSSESAQAQQYVNKQYDINNGRLKMIKSGAEIEAELSFFLPADMVEATLTKIDSQTYYYSYKEDAHTTEPVSFKTDSLVFDSPYTITFSGEKLEDPWQAICTVTFSFDKDGYIHADASVRLKNYISYVVGYQTYYYGYYNNNYSMTFISANPVK